jgi:hypothetical protein
MRRRHRHLNARHLGAKLVLDARYIDQSDNTAVSTWADRSGNGYDATQASGTLQPTFQTAEFGGNGVVRFDGSNDVLNANGAAGVMRNVGGGTLLGVVKYAGASIGSNPSFLFFSRGDNANSTRVLLGGTDNPNPPGSGYALGGRRLDPDSFVTVRTGIYTQNRTLIQAGVFDWANSDAFVFLDGKQEGSDTNFQTAGNTSNTDSLAVRVGLSDPTLNQYLNGDIGQALAFNTALTASQRKRVEHAAAYSFKISCN